MISNVSGENNETSGFDTETQQQRLSRYLPFAVRHRREGAFQTASAYIAAIEKFSRMFPERDDIRIFSAPGRSEIGGNHTDHQHGCALAAAINLDRIADAVSLEDFADHRFSSAVDVGGVIVVDA